MYRCLRISTDVLDVWCLWMSIDVDRFLLNSTLTSSCHKIDLMPCSCFELWIIIFIKFINIDATLQRFKLGMWQFSSWTKLRNGTKNINVQPWESIKPSKMEINETEQIQNYTNHKSSNFQTILWHFQWNFCSQCGNPQIAWNRGGWKRGFWKNRVQIWNHGPCHI